MSEMIGPCTYQSIDFLLFYSSLHKLDRKYYSVYAYQR